jgi:hypothetical protein
MKVFLGGTCPQNSNDCICSSWDIDTEDDLNDKFIEASFYGFD